VYVIKKIGHIHVAFIHPGITLEYNMGNVIIRVTVKSEDTKWKDQLYLESIKGEVTGAFPSFASHRIVAVWHSDNILAAFSNIEALWKLKQTRTFEDGNLVSGLRVNTI